MEKINQIATRTGWDHDTSTTPSIPRRDNHAHLIESRSTRRSGNLHQFAMPPKRKAKVLEDGESAEQPRRSSRRTLGAKEEVAEKPKSVTKTKAPRKIKSSSKLSLAEEAEEDQPIEESVSPNESLEPNQILGFMSNIGRLSACTIFL